MAKFPQTIHKLMESLDLEHTLYLHMLFMNHYIDSHKYSFRDEWDVDDFCTCYNDMMRNPIPDNVGDCNRGLEYFLKQWYEDVPSRYKKAIRDLKQWAAHEYVAMPATYADEIDAAWIEKGDETDEESLFAVLLPYPKRIFELTKEGRYQEAAGNLFHLFDRLGDLDHRRQQELFKQKDCTMRKMQIIQDLLSDVYSNLHGKVSQLDDYTLLNDMDAKLLLFQTRTNLFWEGCSTYENMYSDDFELDENGGMWQWYLGKLAEHKGRQ